MNIFTINPGSTSTKIAVANESGLIFSLTLHHDAGELAAYPSLTDQYHFRTQAILRALQEHEISLETVEAFVGRAGGLLPMKGGVYAVDDLLLAHSIGAANGVLHAANTGPSIAQYFANIYHKPAFVVNPPDVDELCGLARITGIKGVYRTVHLHALNLKETAIRHSARMGRNYDDCNYIVCHIGGGISVSAHRKGQMIDGNDISGGEGPMTPTRCGSISVSNLLAYQKSNPGCGLSSLCTSQGGFVSHFGTSDAREIIRRSREGDETARLVFDAMIYQICKSIGAMAAVLKGQIDAILLGGGLVNDASLAEKISAACDWMAPVYAYPGEFEMEAMAAGAIRALTGKEEIKTYTGIPVWGKTC